MERSALDSGRLSSPHSKEYAGMLSRLSEADLYKNVKRLLLTPADEYHQSEFERLNYVLSWALATGIVEINTNTDSSRSKLRRDLGILTSEPLAKVRDRIFAGEFDSDISYLSKWVHTYAEKVR